MRFFRRRASESSSSPDTEGEAPSSFSFGFFDPDPIFAQLRFFFTRLELLFGTGSSCRVWSSRSSSRSFVVSEAREKSRSAGCRGGRLSWEQVLLARLLRQESQPLMMLPVPAVSPRQEVSSWKICRSISLISRSISCILCIASFNAPPPIPSAGASPTSPPPRPAQPPPLLPDTTTPTPPQSTGTSLPGSASLTRIANGSANHISQALVSGTDETVGPGKYQVAARPATAGSRFPKGQRLASAKESSPGPGYYYVQTSLQRKGITISGKCSPDTRQADRPGPQTYQVEQKKTGPKYSFGKGKREVKKGGVELAGPGQYQSVDLFKSAKITFSKASRVSSGKQLVVPGPGQYELGSSLLQGHRSTSSNNNRSTFGRAPSQQNFNTLIPGPGQYELSSNSLKKVGCSFGKSKRTSVKTNCSPGPGNYNITNGLDVAKSKQSEITLVHRQKNQIEREKAKSPGPGHYQIQLKIQGPKYSIAGGKSKQLESAVIPGPGQYELPEQRRPASAKFGTSKRVDLSAQSRQKVPGPGYYDAVPQSLSPKWVFSKQVKRGKESSTPGPGQYDIPTLVGDEPAYVFRRFDPK